MVFGLRRGFQGPGGWSGGKLWDAVLPGVRVGDKKIGCVFGQDGRQEIILRLEVLRETWRVRMFLSFEFRTYQESGLPNLNAFYLIF